VLEQLNKTGVASRSEITDAYKAAQSECIMVNKGTHVLEVLSTLQNVAKRSRRHHLKKRYALPPLQIAADFFKKHK
jgi:pyruvate kinase